MDADSTTESASTMPVVMNIQRTTHHHDGLIINEDADAVTDVNFETKNIDNEKELSEVSDVNIDSSSFETSKRQCTPLWKLIVIIMILYFLAQIISRNKSD